MVISVLNLMESKKYSPGCFKFLINRAEDIVQRLRFIQWILVTAHGLWEAVLQSQAAEENTKVQDASFQEASYILFPIYFYNHFRSVAHSNRDHSSTSPLPEMYSLFPYTSVLPALWEWEHHTHTTKRKQPWKGQKWSHGTRSSRR